MSKLLTGTVSLLASDFPLNTVYNVFCFSPPDNSPLLLLFCTKAQYLSGKAKVDLIEKVAGIVNDCIMALLNHILLQLQ